MRSNRLALILFFALSSMAHAANPSLKQSQFMKGLDSPWDMAFTPDGVMLFTEKCRGLSVRHQDGKVSRLFGGKGSALVADDFFCEGQSGMHGVALDPKFTSNRMLYVYMPSNINKNPRTNRVVRLIVDKHYTKVSARTDIVADIDFKDKDNGWGGAGSHSGGRIRFGPDGYLYIPTGDNHNGPLPQDLTALGGKVLRVDRDGNGAEGNRTPLGGDPRIFTYGHRNVQGLDFHPVSGRAYIAEHGPGHSDEVTALVAGGNGGWDPKPAPGVDCRDSYCGYSSNNVEGKPTSMTDKRRFPQAMTPLYSYKDSQGLGPLTFLTGKQWKDWNGQIAVGVMRSQRLDILRSNQKGAVTSVDRAPLPRARMRSLVQGPDGNLYIATDGGSIWVVKPQ